MFVTWHKVCVCVCVRARACVCACVCVWVRVRVVSLSSSLFLLLLFGSVTVAAVSRFRLWCPEHNIFDRSAPRSMGLSVWTVPEVDLVFPCLLAWKEARQTKGGGGGSGQAFAGEGEGGARIRGPENMLLLNLRKVNGGRFLVVPVVTRVSKLQALVYDILPSTSAVSNYAIGSRKLSSNE